MRRRRPWFGRWRGKDLVLRFLRGIEHHEVRIVIHPAKGLPHPGQVPQVFKAQVLMLREMIEKLPNFLLYQKEQIPLSGRCGSLAGIF